MNIVVAADKFKHSLTSFEVCAAIRAGFEQVSSSFTITGLPLSDGGDGLTEIIAHYMPVQKITATVLDPLFRPVEATYLLSADGATAYLEMAQASGLHLLQPTEYNCARTSSFGTGQLLKDAMARRVKKMVLGIGGSATNDCGMGMAAALGYQFLDKEGNALPPVGEHLIHVHSIDASEKIDLNNVTLEVASDVINPLTGPNGATHVYAPQKGADPRQVAQLEQGMQHFARVVQKQLGIDITAIKGGGAAGGLGAGCVAFAGARLVSGIDMVLQISRAEEHIQKADVVLTGEGKIDAQTVQGKVVAGIAALSRRWQKPVIALCGALEADWKTLQTAGVSAAFSLCNKPLPSEEALKNAAPLLQQTAAHLAGLLLAMPK